MLLYNLYFTDIILTSYQNDLEPLKYDIITLSLTSESSATEKNAQIKNDEKVNKKKNKKVNKNNINV